MDLHRHSPHHQQQGLVSHTALDDVITRQAVEVAQLKKELNEARSETEATKQRLDTRITVKDEQVKYLETKLQEAEIKHRSEVSMCRSGGVGSWAGPD